MSPFRDRFAASFFAVSVVLFSTLQFSLPRVCFLFVSQFSLPDLRVILVNSKVERNTSRMVQTVKERLKKVRLY